MPAWAPLVGEGGDFGDTKRSESTYVTRLKIAPGMIALVWLLAGVRSHMGRWTKALVGTRQEGQRTQA